MERKEVRIGADVGKRWRRSCRKSEVEEKALEEKGKEEELGEKKRV